jgi:anti-sigma B factor antagonist
VTNFSLQVERNGGAILLAARGDLDLAAAEPAEAELQRAETGRPELLVIDLKGVDFIDSSGLRVLLLAASRASEAGRRFVVARARGQVKRVIEMTGSDKLFELAPELPEPFAGGASGAQY